MGQLLLQAACRGWRQGVMNQSYGCGTRPFCPVAGCGCGSNSPRYTIEGLQLSGVDLGGARFGCPQIVTLRSHTAGGRRHHRFLVYGRLPYGTDNQSNRVCTSWQSQVLLIRDIGHKALCPISRLMPYITPEPCGFSFSRQTQSCWSHSSLAGIRTWGTVLACLGAAILCIILQSHDVTSTALQSTSWLLQHLEQATFSHA